MTSTEPSANVIPATWTTRRVILATVVVLLVALGFLLLFRFRAMILIVFAGIVVSMGGEFGFALLQSLIGSGQFSFALFEVLYQMSIFVERATQCAQRPQVTR